MPHARVTLWLFKLFKLFKPVEAGGPEELPCIFEARAENSAELLQNV